MADFSEADLAPLVIKFLEHDHWEVFQEVRLGGRGQPIVDIVGKQGILVHAVEIKKTFGLSVLQQAYSNLNWFHYSSIAVLGPLRFKVSRERNFAKQICRDYGIGLLTVMMQMDTIEQEISPKLHRKNHPFIKKYVRALLTEDHLVNSDYADAGTKGGRYFTPYKQMIRVVRKYIEDHPGCEINQIMGHLSEELRLNRISYIPRKATLMANLHQIEYRWCIAKQPRGQRQNAYFCM